MVDLPKGALGKPEKMVPLSRGLSAKLKRWSICREPGQGLSAKEPSAWPNTQLCREPQAWLSAKRFSKKNCREPSRRLSAKRFFKKNISLCREPSCRLSAKRFSKKNTSLCREPSWRLSAKTFSKKKIKISLPRAWPGSSRQICHHPPTAVTVTFLCRELGLALGKPFAGSPMNSSRQRPLCR